MGQTIKRKNDFKCLNTTGWLKISHYQVIIKTYLKNRQWC